VTAAGVLVAGALAFALWPARLPSYNGESLTFWFERLPQVHNIRTFAGYPDAPLSAHVTYAQPRTTAVTVGYRVALPTTTTTGSSQDYPAALKAIPAMGTNALPFLIRKLERRPPSPRLAPIRRTAAKWSVTAELFPDVEGERAQAVAGLLVLCPLPPDAQQKLRALSLDFDGPAWAQAGDLLKANQDPSLARRTLSPYR
jgi:hypothetical protein